MPDKDAMRLGAIILAGGRSTRMGRPKESLPFEGNTLLGRTGATLLECCAPVVVVARDATQELPLLPAGIGRTQDEVSERGPLAGLASGLAWLRGHGLDPSDAAMVTACDHPFLSAAAVRWLAERLAGHDAVLPLVGGYLQPLCAIYRLAVLPTVQRLLLVGTSTPRSLATEVSTRLVEANELRTFDPALRFLQNVNTPDDFARAEAHRRDRGEAEPPR